METNNYKQLQRQLKCLAENLLNTVNKTERFSNSIDDKVLEVMLEAGAIEAYYDLQKLLNK